MFVVGMVMVWVFPGMIDVLQGGLLDVNESVIFRAEPEVNEHAFNHTPPPPPQPVYEQPKNMSIPIPEQEPIHDIDDLSILEDDW
jgi:hypothetical protein